MTIEGYKKLNELAKKLDFIEEERFFIKWIIRLDKILVIATNPICTKYTYIIDDEQLNSVVCSDEVKLFINLSKPLSKKELKTCIERYNISIRGKILKDATKKVDKYIDLTLHKVTYKKTHSDRFMSSLIKKLYNHYKDQ